jgi:hypothetical protein
MLLSVLTIVAEVSLPSWSILPLFIHDYWFYFYS